VVAMAKTSKHVSVAGTGNNKKILTELPAEETSNILPVHTENSLSLLTYHLDHPKLSA